MGLHERTRQAWDWVSSSSYLENLGVCAAVCAAMAGMHPGGW